jgi:phage protein U
MTILYVGGVQFSNGPLNPQEIERSGKVAFGVHDVLGAAPVFEHTGFDAENMTVKASVYPLSTGGAPLLDVLGAARRAAIPLPVIRGDGVPLGWYVIEEVSQTHSMLDEGGLGREIEVTAKLRSVGTPDIAMAPQIFNLLGSL